MKRNNVIFFLLCVAILAAMRKIITQLIYFDQSYIIGDIKIYFLYITCLSIFIAVCKDRLLRYSLSLILLSYFITTMAMLININKSATIVLYVAALILLTFAIIYAIKYRLKHKNKVENDSSKLFIIAVPLTIIITVFILVKLYGDLFIK